MPASSAAKIAKTNPLETSRSNIELTKRSQKIEANQGILQGGSGIRGRRGFRARHPHSTKCKNKPTAGYPRTGHNNIDVMSVVNELPVSTKAMNHRSRPAVDLRRSSARSCRAAERS